MVSYSNPLYEDALKPRDNEIGTSGGDEPPGLIGGIASGFAYANAGNSFRYRYQITQLDNANQKKIEAAGFKLEPMFELIDPALGGLRLYGPQTDFQAIMAEGSAFPGKDERYDTHGELATRVRKAYALNRDTIRKAQAARPDLDIQTYEEMDAYTLSEIRKQRTVDPRMGFWGDVGFFAGGMANIGNLVTNPWAPVEMATLAFGGAGPSVVARVGTLAATNAALNVLPQLGGRRALERAGVPLSNEDLVYSAMMGAAGGVLGGLLGEGLAGAAGRSASNKAYSWMSLNKRQSRIGARPELLDMWPPDEPVAPPPPMLPPIQAPTRPPMEPRVPLRADVQQAKDLKIVEAALPMAAREGKRVLDAAETASARVRLAQDLDHTARQMEVFGAAPQDFIPPTRALKDSATAVPDVRTYLGPGIGDVPGLPASWKRASRDVDPNTLETLARKIDPETFTRWDRASTELKAAERALAETSAFHEAATAGKLTALDARIERLQTTIDRAKTATSKAAAQAKIDEAIRYHEEIAATRPGGTPPPPPSKEFDQIKLGERVVEMTARRDALVQDVERALSRAAKRYGLPSAQRDALEDALRPGATDRILSPWRWPKGTKRRKDRPKSVYEVNLLKGPTQEELFAERKLEMAQETSPFVDEGRQPNETQAQTAARVNDLERKNIDEVTANAFVKQVKDFMTALEEKTTKMPVPKAPLKPGEAPPVIPSMPSGMSLEDLSTWKGFDVNGKPGTLKDAMQDLLGDAEAHAAMTSCSIVP